MNPPRHLTNLESSLFMMLEERELSGGEALRQSRHVCQVLKYGAQVMAPDGLLGRETWVALADVIADLASACRAATTLVSMNGEKHYLCDCRSDAGFYKYGFKVELGRIKGDVERLLKNLQEVCKGDEE